jgi:hypothetical protein
MSLFITTLEIQERRDLCLEEQVVDISRDISILMVNPTRNLRPFKEFEGSNLEIESYGKLRDNEDLKKDSRK